MTTEVFRLCRSQTGSDTVIRNLHGCVPMLGRSTGEQPLVREAVARMQLYCLRHGMPTRPIILTGYPKSGNTLTRLVAFPEEPEEDIDIDAFVLRELPDWIGLYRANKPHAKALLRYEAMMADAQRAFGTAFRALGVSFATEPLKRAVAMTSFHKVRAMEDAYGEHHGHAADSIRRERVGDRAWRHAPGVRFTRSGQIGQWRDALKPETIERAMAMLKAAGLVQYATLAHEVETEFARSPRLALGG